MRWEYFVDVCDNIDELRGNMADFGKQGWELVTVVVANGYISAFYKRPLPLA